MMPTERPSGAQSISPRTSIVATLVVGGLAVAGLVLGATPVGPARLIDLAQVATVAAGGVVALRRRHLPLPAPLLLGAVLVAWTAVSWAASDTSAVVWPLQAVLGLASAVAITTLANRPDRLRLLLGAVVTAGAVAALIAVARFDQWSALSGADVVSGRATGPFTQPNQLGTLSAVAVVIGLGLHGSGRVSRRGQPTDRHARRGGRLATALPLLGAAVAGAGLLLTLSRGAWIASAAGVGALVVLQPHLRRLLPVLVLVATGGLLVSQAADVDAARLVLDRVVSVTAGSQDNPQDRRVEIWAEARHQISESPTLGSGPGSFQAAARARGGEDAEHAHNLLLQTAVDAGLPAAALLLGTVVAVAAGTTRACRRRPADTALLVVPCTGLAVLAVHGLVDHTAVHPGLAALTWLLFGAASAVAAQTKGETPGGGPTRRDDDTTRPAGSRALHRIGAGTVALVAAAALTAPPPAVAASSTRPPLPSVGVHSHATWDGQSDADRASSLDVVSGSGAGWIRFDVGWCTLEPERGTIADRYLERIEGLVDDARDRDLQVLITVWCTPDWAAGEGAGTRGAQPADPDDYADAIERLAGHFEGRVAAWQVWNEPNLASFWHDTDPDAYAQLLRRAGPAVKRGDADALIVTAGLSTNDADWLQRLYDADVGDTFDVVATHPYPGRADEGPTWVDGDRRWSVPAVEQIRAVMEEEGDGELPIWFTEIGWSTHEESDIPPSERGVGPFEQAAHSVDVLQLVAERWPYVHAVFFYTDRDRSTDDVHLANYGLTERDFTPKPVWWALRLQLTLRPQGGPSAPLARDRDAPLPWPTRIVRRAWR